MRPKNAFTKIISDIPSYFLILPAFVMTALFHYWPFYGIIIAFKDFRPRQGIGGSEWTWNSARTNNDAFYFFKQIFVDPDSIRAIRNTLIISSMKLLIMTVVIITMALMLNELRNKLFKRSVQTIIYLPNFFSWVVMGSVIIGMFSVTTGIFNRFIVETLGGQPIPILTNPRYFRTLLYLSEIWKGAGFGSIIYMAAIAGINPEQYESAIIDGANRLQMAWHITLPGIKSVIWLLFLLSVSGILNAGFDQIFNLYTPSTMQVGDIIDTFLFRKAFDGAGMFAYAGAIGISKQVIGVAVLLIMNYVATLTGEESII